jgi:CubicO group peptidase (beta-lactamase class C family)
MVAESAQAIPLSSSTREYWPTKGWKESTPEVQGIDPRLPSDLQWHIEREFPHIRSVLVLRHGYLVFEEYYQGFHQDSLHNVWSVAKGFTSALIGIALGEGYLKGLDLKLMSFLPEYRTAAVDPRTEEITLRHLLTMTSGLDCPDGPIFGQAVESDDTVRFVLEQPMMDEPGKVFSYSSGCAHLLSAVLTRSTNMTMLELAEVYLFRLLGISARGWVEHQGYTLGGHGLSLRTRDLAKFGYLYLNQGEWEGKQVVPSEFVRESTQEHNQGGPPGNVGYGYLWWVTEIKGHPVYLAGGWGGQFVHILPDLDVVVAITSDFDRHHPENKDIVYELVIPAVAAQRQKGALA